MANTAYVKIAGVAAANPGLGDGAAGVEASWIILDPSGIVVAGPAGPFVIANFGAGVDTAEVEAAVTSALQGNYGDPEMAAVFL